MEQLSLLETFVNSDLMKNLSMGDKMLASLYVMILGMGATFVALCILWGLITIMSKIINGIPKEVEKDVHGATSIPSIIGNKEENRYELVAVITAAIAEIMETSTKNIVIKNISRVVDGNS